MFSPYITSRTAELVLECAPPERCEVHTVFSAESFASRASSLQTLELLCNRKVSLFDVPRLHAKVIIVEGQFASIGSQNLTSKGVTNREATVAVTSPGDVAAIETLVQPWIKLRTPISAAMIAKMKTLLPALERQAKELQRQAEEIDREVATAVERDDREAVARRIRHRLARIVGGKTVPLKVARRFIATSAWWLDHPYSPCRAPRHADNLYEGGGEWRIDFGGNTFLVSRAIIRCRLRSTRY